MYTPVLLDCNNESVAVTTYKIAVLVVTGVPLIVPLLPSNVNPAVSVGPIT